ncbi:MAG: L-2-amino-thiazoline-4-carboxylic acid hydrolase [Gemmatimonadota bacterium]|nr:MAG: L-2-amino-thiazoline-4-carboxylic acid hydrolase [Gemmatimonadota bacterium]
MEQTQSYGLDRRGFLGGLLPACAVTCMGSFRLSRGRSTRAGAAARQDTHKFDAIIDPAPTWRRLEVLKIARFLEFSQYLADQMGREQVIEILKSFQSQRNASQARRATQRLGANDFAAFKRFYDPAIPALNRIVTMEIVESSDTAYEWRITECINTEPYLRANAADLGYAAACFGDYAFAESFNPKIRLTRNMTLMEGHTYCNHRYTWEG